MRHYFHLSLKSRLVMLIFFSVFVALAGLTSFFIPLYWNDRTSSIFENEWENLTKTSNQLESLVRLAQFISPELAQDSREVILLSDHVCDSDQPVHYVVSKYYKKHFQTIEVDPMTWVNSIDTFNACDELKKNTQVAGQGTQLKVLHSRTQLIVPYIAVILKEAEKSRLALLSLEDLPSSWFSTIFLTDVNGQVQWSADGESYLKTAFVDVGLNADKLRRILSTQPSRGLAKEGETGKSAEGETARSQVIESSGILTSKPFSTDLILSSLTYRPAVTKPVLYALVQSALFSFGVLFFVFAVGRVVAYRIVHPFEELQMAATKVSSGDFTDKFTLSQNADHDEISAVKHAFNTMTNKITQLINDSHKKGIQESEIKLAKKVQEMTLPPEALDIAKHKIFSWVSYAEQCGGDFWGVVEPTSPDKPLVVMIGDATGHGIPSALLTASVRGALSVLSQWILENADIAADPRVILNHFNKTVFETARGSIEMSFFVAVLDAKEGFLLAANAAHPAPFLMADQDVKSVAFGTSVPLGHNPATIYEEYVSMPWTPGSKLFLYTDGLTDCYQDQKNLFDRKDLRQFLLQNMKADSKGILKRVVDERKHRAPNAKVLDDITAVVCEAKR